MWVYKNKNPLGRQVNDCVIRAISLAEGRSWDDVYSELSKKAQEEGTLIDDVNFVEFYLNDRYKKMCYKKKGLKISLNDFARQFNRGVYLVTMQGHITCVINGIIYDIWDCGLKEIWCAWKVE